MADRGGSALCVIKDQQDVLLRCVWIDLRSKRSVFFFTSSSAPASHRPRRCLPVTTTLLALNECFGTLPSIRCFCTLASRTTWRGLLNGSRISSPQGTAISASHYAASEDDAAGWTLPDVFGGGLFFRILPGCSRHTSYVAFLFQHCISFLGVQLRPLIRRTLEKPSRLL